MTTPEVTSAVVGVFTSAITFWPSIRTASVLVPPTSMPIRICLESSSHLKREPAAFEVFGRDLAFSGAPAGDLVVGVDGLKDLLFLPAAVLGKWAAGGQPAGRRRCDRRWHLTGQKEARSAIQEIVAG